MKTFDERMVEFLQTTRNNELGRAYNELPLEKLDNRYTEEHPDNKAIILRNEETKAFVQLKVDNIVNESVEKFAELVFEMTDIYDDFENEYKTILRLKIADTKTYNVRKFLYTEYFLINNQQKLKSVNLTSDVYDSQFKYKLYMGFNKLPNFEYYVEDVKVEYPKSLKKLKDLQQEYNLDTLDDLFKLLENKEDVNKSNAMNEEVFYLEEVKKRKETLNEMHKLFVELSGMKVPFKLWLTMLGKQKVNTNLNSRYSSEHTFTLFLDDVTEQCYNLYKYFWGK